MKEATFAGNLLLSLINDILDSLQIKNGTLNLDLSSFNIRNLVYETVKLLNSQAKHKNIDINIGISENVDDEIINDGRRLT